MAQVERGQKIGAVLRIPLGYSDIGQASVVYNVLGKGRREFRGWGFGVYRRSLGVGIQMGRSIFIIRIIVVGRERHDGRKDSIEFGVVGGGGGGWN